MHNAEVQYVTTNWMVEYGRVEDGHAVFWWMIVLLQDEWCGHGKIYGFERGIGWRVVSKDASVLSRDMQTFGIGSFML